MIKKRANQEKKQIQPKVGDLVELREDVYKHESIVLVIENQLTFPSGEKAKPCLFIGLPLGKDKSNVFHYDDIECILSGGE